MVRGLLIVTVVGLVEGGRLVLNGADAAVQFGESRTSAVSLQATCGGELPTTTLITPTVVDGAPQEGSSVTVQLGNVAPSCSIVADFRTPCAVPTGSTRPAPPPLYWCRFFGAAEGSTIGPVSASVSAEQVDGIHLGFHTTITCPLPVDPVFATLGPYDGTGSYNINVSVIYYAPSGADAIQFRWAGARGGNMITFNNLPTPPSPPTSPPPPSPPYTDAAVYVTWGSRTCSDKATLLYEGLIGGAGYSNSGGPSNLMCLHGQPQNPSAQTPGTGPDRSNVYGVEYQTEAGYQPPGGAGLSSADGDAACAVCHAETISEVYVQWGRAESCSNGHVTMYSGWMMGEYSGHTGRNEMICASALACTHMATFASMRACAVLDITP